MRLFKVYTHYAKLTPIGVLSTCSHVARYDPKLVIAKSHTAVWRLGITLHHTAPEPQ